MRFIDLVVGDRFRFGTAEQAAEARVRPADVMEKTSAVGYRDAAGQQWKAGPFAVVHRVDCQTPAAATAGGCVSTAMMHLQACRAALRAAEVRYFDYTTSAEYAAATHRERADQYDHRRAAWRTALGVFIACVEGMLDRRELVEQPPTPARRSTTTRTRRA
jgi:hypothetical protein